MRKAHGQKIADRGYPLALGQNGRQASRHPDPHGRQDFLVPPFPFEVGNLAELADSFQALFVMGTKVQAPFSLPRGLRATAGA
jgi:hypothetical protein